MSGTATFSGCAVTQTGSYTLTATSLTSADGATFTIAAGPATGLIVTRPLALQVANAQDQLPDCCRRPISMPSSAIEHEM